MAIGKEFLDRGPLFPTYVPNFFGVLKMLDWAAIADQACSRVTSAKSGWKMGAVRIVRMPSSLSMRTF